MDKMMMMYKNMYKDKKLVENSSSRYQRFSPIQK